jgi:hypothetical protein
MRAFRTALSIGVLTWGCSAMAADRPTVRLVASRMRQPIAEMPPQEAELIPPSNAEEIDVGAEDVPAENVPAGETSGAANNPFNYGTSQGSGLPASPYPAGLSYMMTPQPFRVPIPDRFYYPHPHYVRRCPYYPKGFYWGANWNRRYLPPNNLHRGAFRFNPYLSNRKAHKHGTGGHHHQHRPCLPVVTQSEQPYMKVADIEAPIERQQNAERAIEDR